MSRPDVYMEDLSQKEEEVICKRMNLAFKNKWNVCLATLIITAAPEGSMELVINHKWHTITNLFTQVNKHNYFAKAPFWTEMDGKFTARSDSFQTKTAMIKEFDIISRDVKAEITRDIRAFFLFTSWFLLWGWYENFLPNFADTS